MRTDDQRLVTAAVVLLMTGAFLIPPAKAAPAALRTGTGVRTGHSTGTHVRTGLRSRLGTGLRTDPYSDLRAGLGTDPYSDLRAGLGTDPALGTGHCAFGPLSPPSAGASAGRWTAPTVHYRLSAGYSAEGRHWRHRHTGQDFAVKAGTPVYAVGPGRVVTASCGDGYGNQVVLHHPDGFYTQYAHLSVISVRPGDIVRAGRRIGSAGSTGNADGPHLHFEVRTGPAMGSAVPPLPWLRRHGVRVPP
ncbi:M23 family metallopeptidase [Streptomyces sp. NPDC001068]|uniref:M23 family metallopeptidase n=1 Tax=Streptomyces sp. NPDC001068 TaxID=3364544 RepID=UPI003673917F